MVYKLNVTDHADELLDNLVYHLIYRLKNKEAAKIAGIGLKSESALVKNTAEKVLEIMEKAR